MHRNSLLLFDKYAKPYFKPNLRVLEIGPDTHTWAYRNIVNDNTLTWDTVELFPAPGITHVAKDEYNFPIESDSYDLVLSGQVIEHVRKIWLWMRELARVCKPGGLVITLNPVNWPYHPHPHDCWRIFPEGMKALYDDAGLSVELSHFGSLELATLRYATWKRSPYRTLTATVNRAIGRSGVWGRALDTVTVGRKLPAGSSTTART